MVNRAVTNLSVTNDVTLITLDNIPNNMKNIAGILTTIANEEINIDMISQSTPYGGVINMSFSLSTLDLVRVIQVLGNFKDKMPELRVDVNSSNSKLCLYGEAMKSIPGVAAKFFALLEDNDIPIKLVTTSEVDISCLIHEKDVDKARNCVKEAFNI